MKAVKPKTHRVARTRAGGEWTEAKLWGAIRSALRKCSHRWPPITKQALNNAKRSTGVGNRVEFQCAICLEWKKRDDVAVDHIDPCGQLKNADDLPGFVTRLFCEAEGLRVLCEKCHLARTAKEKADKKIASDGSLFA